MSRCTANYSSVCFRALARQFDSRGHVSLWRSFVYSNRRPDSHCRTESAPGHSSSWRRAIGTSCTNSAGESIPTCCCHSCQVSSRARHLSQERTPTAPGQAEKMAYGDAHGSRKNTVSPEPCRVWVACGASRALRGP